MHSPQVRAKNLPPFSMVHLLHRLYGVDAPAHGRHTSEFALLKNVDMARFEACFAQLLWPFFMPHHCAKHKM